MCRVTVRHAESPYFPCLLHSCACVYQHHCRGGTRIGGSPLSVAAQGVILSGNGGGSLGGTTQLGVGLGYDFGPPIIVPVRATAQFDYNGGSNGGGSLTTYGFTVGARLTTPIYAGIGIGPYFTSLKQPLFMVPESPALPVFPPVFISTPNGSATAAGFGTKFTVGDRILSLPGGVSLALEASYQLLPTV